MEQLGAFQNACRETARRVGVTPFTPEPSELFDPQRHQSMEGDAQPAPGSLIQETLAAGYTFQGRMVRPALVRLSNDNRQMDSASKTNRADFDENQTHLPLDQPATA